MKPYFLDTCRLLCPMPVIKTQDKVKDLVCGDQLEVLCTDPGALHDIPAWCRINGHKVLQTHSGEGEYKVLLEVGEK